MPEPETYQRTGGDPPDPRSVRRLTFVLFFPDGRTAALREGRYGAALPEGRVEPGEHWLFDSSLTVPLATAGFRRQRTIPFAVQGDRLYVWTEGDLYRGDRPARTDAPLLVAAPAEVAAALRARGAAVAARAVEDAADARAHETDDEYFAANNRLLEPAYLAASTPEGGSGMSGGPEKWRARREQIAQAVHRDGAFLDLGCANGLLMESVAAWCAERGLRVEPYGVDLGAELVALARRRLPHWSDRLFQGNALTWRPADGRRFDFVHVLLDVVPHGRRRQLVDHALHLVEPGGRLLASHYVDNGAHGTTAAGYLRRFGLGPDGVLPRPDGGSDEILAWVTRR